LGLYEELAQLCRLGERHDEVFAAVDFGEGRARRRAVVALVFHLSLLLRIEPRSALTEDKVKNSVKSRMLSCGEQLNIENTTCFTGRK
jgi:hypothetical protein